LFYYLDDGFSDKLLSLKFCFYFILIKVESSIRIIGFSLSDSFISELTADLNSSYYFLRSNFYYLILCLRGMYFISTNYSFLYLSISGPILSKFKTLELKSDC